VAREVARASIVALDASPAALEVARRNALKHGVADRVELLVSNLFAAVRGRRFDVVVANPPYVAREDLAKLEPELGWEPNEALDGGSGGLRVIQRLLAETAAALVSDGWLVMEIGADQTTAVEALALECGFGKTLIRPDYAGLPRVLTAQVN
jgi:release factor glutamine methyltransferase